MLPLVGVLAILLTVMGYIVHLGVIAERHWRLRSEIRHLRTAPLSDAVPAVKRLEALWDLHGLDAREYLRHERLALHGERIDILYGAVRGKALRLPDRADEIGRRHVKVNQPFYEGQSGAAHLHFKDPVDMPDHGPVPGGIAAVRRGDLIRWVQLAWHQ